MLQNRTFNVLIAAALLVMAVMLALQGVATAGVVASPANASYTSAHAAAPAPLPFSVDDIRALRAAYVKDMGLWLARTPHGPAGVDGGVLDLRNYPARAR
jgi:hypothetical protein